MVGFTLGSLEVMSLEEYKSNEDRGMRLAWGLLGKEADACGLMHAGLRDDLSLV